MARVYNGRSVPDPGNPNRRRKFWIAAILLITAVTVSQQWRVNEARLPKPVPTVEPINLKKDEVKPIGAELDAADMTSRLLIKLDHAMRELDPSSGGAAMYSQSVDPGANGDLVAAVKLAPAYADLAGKDAALKALEELNTRLEEERLKDKGKGLDDATITELETDVDLLVRLYTDGSAKLKAEDADRITKRFGWSGRLALTFDNHESPERAALLANSSLLLWTLVLLAIGVVLVGIAGFTFFVVAIVMLATGRMKPRLDRAAPGGSLGVEVLTVFLCGFLGLKIVMTVLAYMIEHGWLGASLKADSAVLQTVIALVSQWIILPMVVFYPRLRGDAGWRIKRTLGWHNGSGLLKEVGAGIAGYLACMPLYLVGLLIAAGLIQLEQWIVRHFTDHVPTGPVNPIGELLSQSWWMAILVVLLATVWAPIVEESVFRGGLFRQLHSRMGVVWAALISGTVFAMMHGYSPSLFPPLIILGGWFAMMRWWRGSLVSCITAHALHNGTITVMTLIFFTLLK